MGFDHEDYNPSRRDWCVRGEQVVDYLRHHIATLDDIHGNRKKLDLRHDYIATAHEGNS